jgi:amidohydrolase
MEQNLNTNALSILDKMFSHSYDYSSTDLRKKLNDSPEQSGYEFNTCRIIKSYLEGLSPDRIVKNKETESLLAILGKGKKTVMFRSDMDAVHVGNGVYWHLCGHDGHTAIGCELGRLFTISDLRNKGCLALFFQSAEETGRGCLSAIKSGFFKDLNPDYVLSLHNLPGFPLGSVIVREGSFSSASTGLRLYFSGVSSHACSPDQGISPVIPLLKLVGIIPDIANKDRGELATIIHIRAGDEDFGITPKEALISLTLRAKDDTALSELAKKIESTAHKYALDCGTRISKTELTEYFPDVWNDAVLVGILKDVAKINSYNVIEPEEPFKWSEDFGHFKKQYKSAMFGLGNGEDSKGLHEEGYEFSDSLVKTGAEFLMEVLRRLFTD